MGLESAQLLETLLEQFPMENGAIDLSKLILLPVGSTHQIYKVPGNDNILLKVVIESLYYDDELRKKKYATLKNDYAKLYQSFGQERCLVESRFIRKIKDPNSPESLEAIVSLVNFDNCFQSEHRFGFVAESIEANEMLLRDKTAQYHAMNQALLGTENEVAFNEEDFLIFHKSFQTLFKHLDKDPALKEVMREFLGKFKKYYVETGALFDLIGPDNVLFYKDKNGDWQYKVGAVLKELSRDKTLEVLDEVKTNPAAVQASFENWVPVFYMPSCLRILNATAKKLGMDKVVSDISISQNESENLAKMYEMLSLSERVYYCTDGETISFEDVIYNLAQFILENKAKKFFNENRDVTKYIFERTLEAVEQKYSQNLNEKSREMIAIINDLVPDITQHERNSKLARLHELGLDKNKPFALPEAIEPFAEKMKRSQSSEVAQQRKHFTISRTSSGEIPTTKSEDVVIADKQPKENAQFSPNKKK